jgi:hypothetical protein
MGAAYDALVEDCTKEQLADLVLALMHEKRELILTHAKKKRDWEREKYEMAEVHEARVTELLEANNREVERRRAAEAVLRGLEEHRRIPSSSDMILCGKTRIGSALVS